MDITDFDKMEQESSSRLFIDECPNCGYAMINKYSKKYGNYKHCNVCEKNYKPKTI
jgi:hypothetical protein